MEILATQLSHIVDEEAKNTLLTEELVAYQRVETSAQLCEVDESWASVAEMTLGGEKQFPILSKLALACSTIVASSSEVEQEFSSISDVFANPKVHNLTQELLDAKQVVKSAERAEGRYCARCKEREKERKEKQLKGEKLPRDQCRHCHCSLLQVDDNLLAELRNKQPSKTFVEEKERHKEETAEEKKRLEVNKIKDQAEAELTLKKEVAEMKKRYQESLVRAVKRGEDVKKVKVPKKKIGIEKEAESEMTKKKQKLAFVFEKNFASVDGERSKGAPDNKKSKEKESSHEVGGEKRKVGGEKGRIGGEKGRIGVEKGRIGVEKGRGGGEKRKVEGEGGHDRGLKRSNGSEKKGEGSENNKEREKVTVATKKSNNNSPAQYIK